MTAYYTRAEPSGLVSVPLGTVSERMETLKTLGDEKRAIQDQKWKLLAREGEVEAVIAAVRESIARDMDALVAANPKDKV